MILPDAVRAAPTTHPHPLLFATISGAHLYGFASPDSDWDLRGCHLLPAKQVLGLQPLEETIEVERTEGDVELDLVSHDAGKFFRLLLKPNGYVLEQLYSPLLVVGGPAHDELKAIARGCITRNHAHHYKGFARTQWNLLEKESVPRVKPLLYVVRVLLTGIHLMRTGRVEANLPRLLDGMPVEGIRDLVARKTAGAERAMLAPEEVEGHRRVFERLLDRLEAEARASDLPDRPSARDALSDLLVRLRLDA